MDEKSYRGKTKRFLFSRRLVFHWLLKSTFNWRREQFKLIVLWTWFLLLFWNINLCIEKRNFNWFLCLFHWLRIFVAKRLLNFCVHLSRYAPEKKVFSIHRTCDRVCFWTWNCSRTHGSHHILIATQRRPPRNRKFWSMDISCK